MRSDFHGSIRPFRPGMRPAPNDAPHQSALTGNQLAVGPETPTRKDRNPGGGLMH